MAAIDKHQEHEAPHVEKLWLGAHGVEEWKMMARTDHEFSINKIGACYTVGTQIK